MHPAGRMLRKLDVKCRSKYASNRAVRVVAFGDKLLPFVCKSEIRYFCYNPIISCYYFT